MIKLDFYAFYYKCCDSWIYEQKWSVRAAIIPVYFTYIGVMQKKKKNFIKNF
jgi:hypothetical protein